MPFNIQWTQNSQPVSGDVYFSVTYPSQTSSPISLTFKSPATMLGSQEILTNTKVYLGGKDADTLLGWTNYPSTTSGGGVQVSFDNGRTWILFNNTTGNYANPSTWVEIPASAMGALGVAGVINPYDSVTVLLQVTVPASYTNYGILCFNLGIDFDVI